METKKNIQRILGTICGIKEFSIFSLTMIYVAQARYILTKFSYILNRLRVVPLFETVKDLRGAGAVIRKLLSIDWYREHIIKNHNGHQEVLISRKSYDHFFMSLLQLL